MDGNLVKQVQVLEALCHRYLNEPHDKVEQAALLKGLAGFPVDSVTEDQPPVVRGIAAPCYSYAQLLSEDLVRGKSPEASVQRLCGLLADLKKALT